VQAVLVPPGAMLAYTNTITGEAHVYTHQTDRRLHGPQITRHDEQIGRRIDDWLDQALADTFPASDPLATPPMRTRVRDRVAAGGRHEGPTRQPGSLSDST
jgi:hypothetical protein